MSKKPIGVILAGGKGARMGGRDKGLLEINGRKLIELTITAVTPQVSNLVISANRNHDEYQRFTNHVVADISNPYSGPLAGIFSVMEYLQTFVTCSDNAADLLIVPCDMPLLPADLTARLYETRLDNNKLHAVAVNDGDRFQPLCCLLPLALKPNLKIFLDAGHRKVMHWLQSINVVTADFSDEKSRFANINSNEDLLALTSSLISHD